MFDLLPLLVSTLTYVGLILLVAGAVSLLKPLRFLRIRSRRAALAVLPIGLLLAYTGAWWPWAEQRASGSTQLDAFVPAYQFAEFHETRVRAAPESVYRAIRAVSAAEIRAFRTLTWIRHPRLPWGQRRESILDPGANQPILDVATRTSFVWLADEPGREALVGTVVCCQGTPLASADAFRGLTQAGVAKAGMNFRIEDLGGGECRVTTETRVFATDSATRRRFGLYWAFIYPGSVANPRRLAGGDQEAGRGRRTEAQRLAGGHMAAPVDRPRHGIADLEEIVHLIEDDLARVEDFFEEQVRSDVPLIAEVGRYIRDGGGKRIRPALLLLSCRISGYRGERAILLAAVVELIHTATLLHDDIIDEATVRRGRRSVNSRWGNDLAVLLGRLPVHEVDIDGAVPGQPADPAAALGRDAPHDRGRDPGDPALRGPGRDAPRTTWTSSAARRRRCSRPACASAGCWASSARRRSAPSRATG